MAKVRADFGFIEATGRPGHDAPPPEPFKLREREVSKYPAVPGTRTGSSRSAVESDTNTEVGDRGEPSQKKPPGDAFDDAVEIGGERTAEQPPLMRSGAPVLELHKNAGLPQDVKSLRGRMWTLAMQLAQPHRLSSCIHPCPAGCGFIMDLPEHRLYAGEEPESAEEAQRVTLWWMLAALSEEWPYGIGQAPSLAFLEAARIYPAIVAAAEDDRSTLTDILMPWVSFPPSLDIAVRQLFATLGDRDYGRLLKLIDTRRALQDHCRRLGKRIVWEI